MLFTVWVICLADLLFTLWAHWFTPFYEVNPLARSLLDGNWVGSLVAFKVVLTAGGTGIFWLCRRRRTTELATWTVAAAYIVLAMQWASYTQAAMVELARGF